VINFAERSEEEARQWPDLMQIVEEKVKPQRIKDKRDTRRKYWWRFGEPTPALFDTIRGMERVLICSRHQPYWSVTFTKNGSVFSEALVVFALEESAALGLLQSSVHEVWARFFASSIKDDLRYTPSDCFETFPFPANFESNERFEAVGKEYYEFRAQLMVTNNEGMTKTYNRFHDPSERSPETQKFRELHAAMDRAVLDAYGWTDLTPTYRFLLDYEEDEDDTDSSSRRKKPWRYRWPDDFRDEVLARLLELNKERADQERLAGLAAEADGTNRGNRGRSKAKDGKQSRHQSGESHQQTLELLRNTES
jgi:hypothetical protein